MPITKEDLKPIHTYKSLVKYCDEHKLELHVQSFVVENNPLQENLFISLTGGKLEKPIIVSGEVPSDVKTEEFKDAVIPLLITVNGELNIPTKPALSNAAGPVSYAARERPASKPPETAGQVKPIYAPPITKPQTPAELNEIAKLLEKKFGRVVPEADKNPSSLLSLAIGQYNAAEKKQNPCNPGVITLESQDPKKNGQQIIYTLTLPSSTEPKIISVGSGANKKESREAAATRLWNQGAIKTLISALPDKTIER